MTTIQLRRQAKKRLDVLPEDRLAAADDFLAYLEERESNEATAELLRIPGLVDRVRKAEKQVATGRTVPATALRRKY